MGVWKPRKDRLSGFGVSICGLIVVFFSFFFSCYNVAFLLFYLLNKCKNEKKLGDSIKLKLCF